MIFNKLLYINKWFFRHFDKAKYLQIEFKLSTFYKLKIKSNEEKYILKERIMKKQRTFSKNSSVRGIH